MNQSEIWGEKMTLGRENQRKHLEATTPTAGLRKHRRRSSQSGSFLPVKSTVVLRAWICSWASCPCNAPGTASEFEGRSAWPADGRDRRPTPLTALGRPRVWGRKAPVCLTSSRPEDFRAWESDAGCPAPGYQGRRGNRPVLHLCVYVRGPSTLLCCLWTI